MWLPPLNHFPRYDIFLTAAQDQLPRKKDGSLGCISFKNQFSEPYFAIKVHVQVRFSSHSGSDLGFKGLDYSTKEFLIPSRALISSPPEKAEMILRDKFSKLRIPFRLHDVVFAHKYYGEDCSPSTHGNWIEKLRQFLISMKKKSYNFHHHVLPLNLTIDKSVIIPDKFCKGWRCWYDHSRELDPDFENKYRAAIGRPRTNQELLCEPGLTFDEVSTAILKNVTASSLGSSCSICLEEGGLKGLCCGHIFHGNCIEQWFQRNQVCPICRYTLPFTLVWGQANVS